MRDPTNGNTVIEGPESHVLLVLVRVYWANDRREMKEARIGHPAPQKDTQSNSTPEQHKADNPSRPMTDKQVVSALETATHRSQSRNRLGYYKPHHGPERHHS